MGQLTVHITVRSSSPGQQDVVQDVKIEQFDAVQSVKAEQQDVAQDVKIEQFDEVQSAKAEQQDVAQKSKDGQLDAVHKELKWLHSKELSIDREFRYSENTLKAALGYLAVITGYLFTTDVTNSLAFSTALGAGVFGVIAVGIVIGRLRSLMCRDRKLEQEGLY